MFAANRDDHVAAELTPVEINRSGNSAKSFLTGKVGVMSPASVSRTSCDIVWNTRRRAPVIKHASTSNHRTAGPFR